MLIGLVQGEGPLLTETHSSTDETPEAGAPPAPAGSLKATETGKLSLVCDVPSELTTWLVGGVVSISHEVESESGAGDTILVLDVGGVDRQRVLALGRGQAVRPLI